MDHIFLHHVGEINHNKNKVFGIISLQKNVTHILKHPVGENNGILKTTVTILPTHTRHTTT